MRQVHKYFTGKIRQSYSGPDLKEQSRGLIVCDFVFNRASYLDPGGFDDQSQYRQTAGMVDQNFKG